MTNFLENITADADKAWREREVIQTRSLCTMPYSKR